MRFVSILGDSISTYEGYNPPGYAVYYSGEVLAENRLRSVYDTWWVKVNQALDAFLCVNNSYSGSRVSGWSFPAGVSEERLDLLRSSRAEPDLILIYLGFNDFGYGVRICRSENVKSQGRDLGVFRDAYALMLESLRRKYPDSAIVCGTLMRTAVAGRPNWQFPERMAGISLERYNQEIRDAAARQGCFLADLSAMDLRYETLDGAHPTIDGHRVIAEAWIRQLEALGLLQPSAGSGQDSASEGERK